MEVMIGDGEVKDMEGMKVVKGMKDMKGMKGMKNDVRNERRALLLRPLFRRVRALCVRRSPVRL
jgi:hypothetical protein